MYHIKLVKGLSYSGLVTATAASPYVNIEDAETAEKLLETGYFQLISNIEPEKSTAKSREKKGGTDGTKTMDKTR